MPDLDKIFVMMFGLILVFLVLSRSNEATSIISSAGGFLNNQTRILQGVNAGGTAVIPGTNPF